MHLTNNTHQPLVLVVEDNALNRETILDYLDFVGYRAIAASNGLQALDRINTHQPDVVLMDMKMPLLNGFEAMRQLRAQGNTTPIIALTGMARRRDAEQCLAAGANTYIQKPMRFDDLVNAIDHLLQKRTPTHQRAIIQ